MNALPSLPGLPALPILSILLALPLLGAATCFLLRDERTVRAVAIATATLAQTAPTPAVAAPSFCCCVSGLAIACVSLS